VTTVHPDAHPALAPRERDPQDARYLLRDLVRADAAVCALSGLALLLASDPLSDVAGVATTTPARGAGAFLVLLGVGLAWLSNVSDRTRLRWVPLSASGDLVWGLASLAVAVLVDLSGAGRTVIALQGLLVLAIGEAKLVLHRRARVARLDIPSDQPHGAS
jgi:hypothetical protein